MLKLITESQYLRVKILCLFHNKLSQQTINLNRILGIDSAVYSLKPSYFKVAFFFKHLFYAMKRARLYLLAGIFLIPLLLIFSQCFRGEKPADARGEMYAGSKTCRSCHAGIYTSNLHTAHFLASQPANAQTVSGSFHADSNVFKADENLFVRLEKDGNSLFQSAYFKGKKIQSERFDIVFGGVKGESYLYLKNNRFFQLPVSYANQLHSWSSSPGYAPGDVDFGRAIGRRCFECHASYIKEIPGKNSPVHTAAAFEENSVVYGIDCERCHGPAAKHVQFHQRNPVDKAPHFIRSYASLSRSQKLDACAVCHSGNTADMLRSTFSFLPGDTLSSYQMPDLYSGNMENEPDVHGNQLQLLSSSACFIHSKMDCGTCHDPHKNERKEAVLFAQKCLSCHARAREKACKMGSVLSADVLKANCIQCHMPARPSKSIGTQTSGAARVVPYKVVTHRIAIYPKETESILSYLKKELIK